MISPEKIPTFTGDLGELGREIVALRQAAKAISEHGSDVHTRFQGLSASYQAPEAGQLFATTQAVQETSGSFAERLLTVAGALETYAIEVAEIVKQLELLRWQATQFVESVKGHDGLLESWQKDKDKVDEHQALWDGVNAAVAAFQQAEVTCADKITALVDGTQWAINNGSRGQKNAYGFSAEQLDQAESLPWGSPEHHQMLPFGIDYHLEQAGISIVDNAVGSVEGLIDLFSPGEDGGAAREGLVRVIIGAEGYLLDPHGDRKDLSPSMKKLMDDSKPYAKEFGKSFVAWDDWSTNPGKAMGTVIFNGLTLGAGPLGAASKAGKAGGISRVAGNLAKVGEVLDPISAAAKTVGTAARALPKVAELTAGVRGATDAAAATDAAHSFIEYPDGSQLRIENGEFIPGKKDVPDTTPAPHEPAAADRAPSIETPRQHELVGAGARVPQAHAEAGENLPPQGSHDTSHDPAGGGGERDGEPQKTGGGHDSGHAADSPGRSSHSGAEQGGSADHHGDAPDAPHGTGSGSGNGADGTGGSDSNGASLSSEPQPMARGGETEQRVRDAVKGIPGKKRPKPNVLERVLDRLASEPDGQRVAEVIGSGQFNQSDEFGQVVSALGANKLGMFQPSADQIIFADDLVKSGVPAHAIDFEQKVPVGADVDVRIKDETGDIYAYQMKHLNDPQDAVSEITRGKYLLQLAKAEANHHVLLVDGGRGTRADWISSGSYDALMDIHRGGRGPKGEGITFVIRLEDGNLVIPPGSKLDPKDML
ncbi:hypothetical protein QFZ82_001685 [Streptomyces sp. V4I23]|uniref:hypothetical protein n=1 Tax=Streptomyces sp. V4I23 TaxID=3042282 RepID=UPI002788A574|nr:hypothetical protein [Streptomyces sp. V4I23]MDQ1007200.1 hypothetical protein [Streptomyces sp. V4I23]